MKVWRMTTCVCTVAMLAVLVQTAGGDGGQVRFSRRSGPYVITVFTTPTPLRVGRADVSVMVQDPETEQIAGNVEVSVHLTSRQGRVSTRAYPATRKQATNKLLEAATVDFPSPGWWTIAVKVKGTQGPSQVQFTTEVLAKSPPWFSFFPWIAWPLAPIGLFALREFVVFVNRSAGVKAAGRE